MVIRIGQEEGRPTPQRDEWLRRLFEAHFDAVRSYCLRRLPIADANDAVAEVFVIAWRKRSSVPEVEAARPWLYATARNVIWHSLRSGARQIRLRSKLDGLGSPDDTGPEAAVVRRAEDERVLQALRTLRPSDQEVLMLRAWEELTAAEIAESLDISVAAAEKRLERALGRLERALERDERSTGAHSHRKGGER